MKNRPFKQHAAADAHPQEQVRLDLVQFQAAKPLYVGQTTAHIIHGLQRVFLVLMAPYIAVKMYHTLEKTLPKTLAFKEAAHMAMGPSSGMDACFDPIRMNVACMRVNCIYRTVETTRDATLCEGLEAKQRRYHVDSQWQVTRQDCLDRLAQIATGKMTATPGRALRVACAASISNIAVGHVPPVSMTAKPGATLHFNYEWMGPGMRPSNFQVFVRILDHATGSMVFQDVYNPPIPTPLWRQKVRYAQDVHLPGTLKPGAYDVVSGLWEPDRNVPIAFKMPNGVAVEEFQLAWLQIQ